MSWVRVFQEEQIVTVKSPRLNEFDRFQKWKEDMSVWDNTEP